MSCNYASHLESVNFISGNQGGDGNAGSDQNNEDNESDGDENVTGIPQPQLGICPIALSDVDAKNRSATVTVISNTTDITDPKDIDELKQQGFVIPNDKTIKCHRANVYDLTAAHHWFVMSNGTDPLSRRSLTQAEKNRIQFRYDFQGFHEQQIEDSELHAVLFEYLESVQNDKEFDDEKMTILRCHMTPQRMPNFLDVDRIAANKILEDSFEGQKKLTWLIRP